MTSPPRPPSPPSGPPMGTNFSRRNELAPDPPVPASTRTTTRSMNTVSRTSCVVTCPSTRANSWRYRPRVVGPKQIRDRVERVERLRRATRPRASRRADANAADDPGEPSRTRSRCTARDDGGRAPDATAPCRSLPRSSTRRAPDAAGECCDAAARRTDRTPLRTSLRLRLATADALSKSSPSSVVGRCCVPEIRRHSRAALSARGNPANRYDCSTTSSTHSGRQPRGARRARRALASSLPAAMTPASRTSASVSASSALADGNCITTGRIRARHLVIEHWSDPLQRDSVGSYSPAQVPAGSSSPTTSPRVLRMRARAYSARLRRASLGQRVEQLEHAQHGRVLRARRAVLDLDREPDALIEDRDAVDAFGADLRDRLGRSVSSTTSESNRSVPPNTKRSGARSLARCAPESRRRARRRPRIARTRAPWRRAGDRRPRRRSRRRRG